MRRIFTAISLTGAVAVAALAGCSVSANLTVSPEALATKAEDALEKEIGSRPEIDCGTTSIDLVDGKLTVCDLTDPSSGNVYATDVTIRNVDGTRFGIDVKVADAPKS